MESAIVECALAAVSSGVSDLDDVIDYCLAHSELNRIEEDGYALDDYLTFVLDESGRATVTDDRKVVRLDELAQGLVFTHRLTAEEIASDMVPMSPDLASLDLGTPQLSSDKGPVDLEFPEGKLNDLGWVGPADWLSAFSPGEVVAFRRRDDQVMVEGVGDVAEGEAEASAIRAAFDNEVGYEPGRGEETWIVLERALLADPELFRKPVRPISELLVEVGLESDGEFLGPKDEPWKRPGELARERFLEGLADQYDLEDCCEDALEVAIEAWRSFRGGGHPSPRSVNRALGHGRVWEAFGDWLDEYAGLANPPVEEFLSRLVASGHRHIAPTRLLLARHYEAAGRALDAEVAIEQAVSDDPEYGPALAELARYASDRGDAARVVSVLRRIGMEEDHPWLAFHASLGTQWPEVGRNAPCPCGSGRKYKQCHLGRTEVSPKQRVAWLLTKLGMFATLPARRDRLLGLAASAMWEDFEINDMVRMMDDNFITELAVFEMEGIREFFEERRELLPEDEWNVLIEWADTRMRLWEVVAADKKSTVTLLDTRTGESVDVDDRTAASAMRPGDQLLARLLPGWGGHWLSASVVPVLPQHRVSLLEVLDDYYDADNLATWYGALKAPPRLTNREGEPTVVCKATLRPTSTWEELERFLDDAYERDDDEELWRDVWGLNEDERVMRAMMRRDEEGHLNVETNSDLRMDRVLGRLAGIAEVVEESRQPAGTLNKMKDLFGDSPRAAEPEAEISDEALAEIRERMERRWLDESIPALDGLTPREAAADPTRRQDLINLLRSFEQMRVDPQIGMRAEVLRAELGLKD